MEDLISDLINNEEQVETMFSLLEADHSQTVTLNEEFDPKNSQICGGVTNVAAVWTGGVTSDDTAIGTESAPWTAVAAAEDKTPYWQNGSVTKIYKLYHFSSPDSKPSISDLAKQFGCGRHTIWRIVNQKMHKKITDPIRLGAEAGLDCSHASAGAETECRPVRFHLKFDDVINIWNLNVQKLDTYEICERLGISYHAVREVVSGRRHGAITRHFGTGRQISKDMFKHWSERDFALVMNKNINLRDMHIKSLFDKIEFAESVVVEHGDGGELMRNDIDPCQLPGMAETDTELPIKHTERSHERARHGDGGKFMVNPNSTEEILTNCAVKRKCNLTEDAIREIYLIANCRHYPNPSNRPSLKQLSEMFSCSKNVIDGIIRESTYKEITQPYWHMNILKCDAKFQQVYGRDILPAPLDCPGAMVTHGHGGAVFRAPLYGPGSMITNGHIGAVSRAPFYGPGSMINYGHTGTVFRVSPDGPAAKRARLEDAGGDGGGD